MDTFIYCEYAYILRGKKVIGRISGKKFKRINIVAAKCGDNIVALLLRKTLPEYDNFMHALTDCF